MADDEVVEPPEVEDEESEAIEEVESEAEEVEIGFADEAAPASGDSSTIRHLREQIRDRDRRLGEMSKAPPPGVDDPGPEPAYGTGEAYNWDETEWQNHWKDWNRKKALFDQAKVNQDSERQRVVDEYAKDEQRHLTMRAALPVPDAEIVEAVAIGALSQVQQATIKMAATDAAKLFYALGKSPGKLAELSKIENPIKLAAAVARLEGGLKVMPRRQVTEPEEIATGSASMAMKSDKVLERLEKEAEQSGDRTKVQAHKRTLKAKAA